ncbi:hypothetical protein KP509_35G018200 [Ceratopteris richardii]|uniref:Uncharacterized protein n=1 Tax=Ceratopteris richardii TaxID=49495 RepID=A0A8T2QEY2_CERRI|nr:hypothetical protein KP509_35G018200 [Ceratopteris richardii]
MTVKHKSTLESVITICILVSAAVCEVSGGWCIWKWRRNDWKWWVMLIGSVIVITSGILPTLQKQAFNRTYALYGGFFICASFLWGWALDGQRPDLWDIIGSVITLIGVLLIMFIPRKPIQTTAENPVSFSV